MDAAYQLDPELTDAIQSHMSIALDDGSWYPIRTLEQLLDEEGLDLSKFQQVLNLLEDAGFIEIGMYRGKEAIRYREDYDWGDDMYESVRRKKTKRTTKRR